MAGRIPRDFINDLIDRINIVDVIGLRVKLKRAGSNHKGCCPFHNEKTPSFTVSEQKQFYHCFGCGVHGTAIDFLMEHDGMHFVDAVEALAELAGVDVPREGGGNEQARSDGLRPLFSALDEVNQHYQQRLRDCPAAIEYLKQRGLTGAIARQFGIGYADDSFDHLQKEFPPLEESLLRTGMLVKNDNGRVYARFRHRIMFPIRDRRGRVIGFGGRVLDKSEPKYLNSPETPLFHKGSELYGLYEARKSARDKGYTIVVEGYMDVIALAQHGIGNAVATLGTACNEQHCETLFRTVSDIIFCFDGDRAGREAAWRAANAALPGLREGRDVHFLFLPDGEDPDSLVNQSGADGFEQQLTQKKPVVDFLFDYLTVDLDIDSVGGKAKLANKLKPLLERIPAGLYRDLTERRLQSLLGIPIRVATKPTPAASSRQSMLRKAGVATPSAAQPQRTAMRDLVMLLLEHPSLSNGCDAEVQQLDKNINGFPLLLRLLEVCRQQPEANTAVIIEAFRDEQEFAWLQKLAATPYFPDGQNIEADAAREVFQRRLQQLAEQSRDRVSDQLSNEQRTGLFALPRRRS